ncbi:tRNA-specific adenosine deaminase, chloroplastic [Apostasia shenzhenica]|uniref:tRNA-specific adenosine deaminase, chloroplastic n=1 Tax=Apostasia shenzhenica TaxID=1088818 RepID=A0A2I0B7U0_9ASPA|nr:tRNA-specific adenosine deaminase, chloroplastic [Apostasia shenzhenica]
MYSSYSAATLSIRAKCSPFYYCLSPPSGRMDCCHHSCCHCCSDLSATGILQASPRILYGYLLGQSTLIPSRTLLLAARRRLRVSCRILDFDGEFSEMMRLFAEPGERYPGEVGLERSSWKKERREVEIKSVAKGRQSKGREMKADDCSSRRRDRWSSTYEAAASPASSSSRDANVDDSRRRVGGSTTGNSGCSKRISKFTKVDVEEKDVREVRECADDSWREKSYSSKRDSGIDSRKSESSKSNGRYIVGMEDAEDGIDLRISSFEQANSREREPESESVKLSRSPEVQRDHVKRTSGLVNTRRIERGESSATTSRKSSRMDHQVLGYANLGSTKNESRETGIDYEGGKGASYARNNFQETIVRGRPGRGYLVQSSAELGADNKIEVVRDVVEENESRRKSHRLSDVSVVHGSDVKRSSYLEDKVMQMDARSNMVQNSDQVSIDTRTQMQLQKVYEDYRVKERDKKIVKVDDSVQVMLDEKKQYDSGPVEHNDSGRNIQMLGAISGFDVGNLKSNSRYKGKRVLEIEARSNFTESSARMTRDKGTQVEITEANVDQIGMSRFSPSENDTNNFWSPPDGRNDHEECVAIATSNQVSCSSKEQNQANQHGCHQCGVESEREEVTDVDLTLSNQRRVAGIPDPSNSRVENLKESSSNKSSSVVLILERNESQRIPLVGESQQYSTMQIASNRNSDGVSCSPQTQNIGANSMVIDGVDQIRNDAIESSHQSDKSSALYVGESVDNLQHEIMSMNQSAVESKIYCGVQIETSKNGSYAAKTQSQKEASSAETSSAVVIQDWNDGLRSQFTEPSKTETMQMAFPRISGGVSSSSQTPTQADNTHVYRNEIHQIGEHTIESAHKLEKTSALNVSEFVDKLQQEMLALTKCRIPEYQVETNGSGSQESVWRSQVSESEFIDSKIHGDDRCDKEGGRLSSSGSGMKGPTDEMWDVHELSSQKPATVEETDEYASPSEAIHLASTTSASETAISRRSHRSLWSYVADIIRLNWLLRGQSHSSSPKTGKKASSNESLSSEAWFSGPEPDDDEADVSLEQERSGLLKKSAPVKGSVERLPEESTISNKSAVSESYPSSLPNFHKTGLSAKVASSLVDVQPPEYAKLSKRIPSGVVLVEQLVVSTSSAASITTDVVKPGVGDNATVLKHSSTFPVGMKRRGFSSRISQTVDELQAEDAPVREKVTYSNLEISDQSSVPTAVPPPTLVTNIEEGNKPRNDIPKLELDPSRENMPEVGGTTETEIKQMKFHRNKQVLREQFDEWEEAFKRESEQKKFDEFFMREAILDAKKAADIWEVPVGAVLVQNGKIIARGCNMQVPLLTSIFES